MEKQIKDTGSISGFSSYPRQGYEDLIRKMEAMLGQLPRQEARVAQYILLNQNGLALENGKTLARKIGVSEVTVGRLLRRLGCDGTKAFKELLRRQYAENSTFLQAPEDIPKSYEKVLFAETAALNAIFRQAGSAQWRQAGHLLGTAQRVFVTGFQSVRGIAEDFVRRLSLARGTVTYFSPHDNMLAEWTDAPDQQVGSSCLVLVDVVPYARESAEIVRLAKEQGRHCIVVTDEFCHWAQGLADVVIHAPSRTGLFLESITGIAVALALLVDTVAELDPEASQKRLLSWKEQARHLKIF